MAREDGCDVAMGDEAPRTESEARFGGTVSLRRLGGGAGDRTPISPS